MWQCHARPTTSLVAMSQPVYIRAPQILSITVDLSQMEVSAVTCLSRLRLWEVFVILLVGPPIGVAARQMTVRPSTIVSPTATLVRSAQQFDGMVEAAAAEYDAICSKVLLQSRQR